MLCAAPLPHSWRTLLAILPTVNWDYNHPKQPPISSIKWFTWLIWRENGSNRPSFESIGIIFRSITHWNGGLNYSTALHAGWDCVCGHCFVPYLMQADFDLMIKSALHSVKGPTAKGGLNTAINICPSIVRYAFCRVPVDGHRYSRLKLLEAEPWLPVKVSWFRLLQIDRIALSPRGNGRFWQTRFVFSAPPFLNQHVFSLSRSNYVLCPDQVTANWNGLGYSEWVLMISRAQRYLYVDWDFISVLYSEMLQAW